MNALLIDDSMVIRKMLRRILTDEAFGIGSIFEAGDGRQALAVLQSESVHVILCDVNMPVMNGYELLQELRAHEKLQPIPVLMITTEGTHESVLKAVELGAKGYIRKPFTPDEVKQKVMEVLKKEAEK